MQIYVLHFNLQQSSHSDQKCECILKQHKTWINVLHTSLFIDKHACLLTYDIVWKSLKRWIPFNLLLKIFSVFNCSSFYSYSCKIRSLCVIVKHSALRWFRPWKQLALLYSYQCIKRPASSFLSSLLHIEKEWVAAPFNSFLRKLSHIGNFWSFASLPRSKVVKYKNFHLHHLTLT